jgi:glycosyltransferase involved in cell wall biosynthesis
VPNGVDLDYFQGDRSNPEDLTLIFMGIMDYYANVDGVLFFHDEILPRIRKQIPQVTFTILGGNPTPAIRRLGREEGVDVTGYVRDVRPYLNGASVCVVPLRIARGVQNKILEAMAMGVPVVATSRALEGIDAQPGRDILVADGPEEFAHKTAGLLLDRRLQQSISRSARELVEKKYRWDACLQNLDRILEELCQTSPGTAIHPLEPQAGGTLLRSEQGRCHSFKAGMGGQEG